MVNVAPLVLVGQDLLRLVAGDPARALRLVFRHETGKRLADDQADVERQARIGPGAAARTVERNDVVGMLQNDVSGQRIGDDLLQVPEVRRRGPP